MILVGIGANLTSRRFGTPRASCEAALSELRRAGIRILRRSRWYRSVPVPPADQPDYVNGVAAVATELVPAELLRVLHRIEADFGRVRRAAGEPRVIDLDLLAYGEAVIGGPAWPGASGLALPHPRLHERAFVLLPLAEVAPGWRHPLLGATVEELIRTLPTGQFAEPLDRPFGLGGRRGRRSTRLRSR